jgi:uncharacterized DUF497 family protein
VQIEFDPAKDVLNIKKHGISLKVAVSIEWDMMISDIDNSRHDYAEVRMIGFAPIGSVIFCIVFVERSDGLIRVISFRKATKPEVRNYVKCQN